MMKQEGLRVGQAPGAVVKDGGQSNLLCGQYTSSCIKNQIRKEVIMEGKEQPLVKGGCGHSDHEVEQSGMICGVCCLVMLMLLLLIGIAGIIA